MHLALSSFSYSSSYLPGSLSRPPVRRYPIPQQRKPRQRQHHRIRRKASPMTESQNIVATAGAPSVSGYALGALRCALPPAKPGDRPSMILV